VLTRVAFMPSTDGHDFTGAGVFVIVFLAIIVLIFIRVFVAGGRPGRLRGHRSRRRTGHNASHMPKRDGTHGSHRGNGS
jgi:hypothetical protein